MAEQIASPSERAVRVLRSNKYFVLCTAGSNGPWAAALAFVPSIPARLYFVSRTWSQHALDVRENQKVAGVIYDSTASTEDVESIQFSGSCSELKVTEEEARLVLERSARRDGGSLPSDDDVDELCASDELRVYRVDIDHAYVLDQKAWFERGVDAREPIDPNQVFMIIEGDYVPAE